MGHRLAICDAALARPDVDPDRTSFTIALARRPPLLFHAVGVIADTTIDLVGTIGRHHVLAGLLPGRRLRTTPPWSNERSPTTSLTKDPRRPNPRTQPQSHHHDQRRRWSLTTRPNAYLNGFWRHSRAELAVRDPNRGAPFIAFIITGGEGAPSELERDFAVYHYSPERHQLGLVRAATHLDRLDALLWRQSYVNEAPAMLVICADWPQFHWKYRFSRAYRFVYAECGAFMHTALLVGTALGLKTFQTPAIDDRRMCQTLGVVDHELGPIYMATFGRG